MMQTGYRSIGILIIWGVFVFILVAKMLLWNLNVRGLIAESSYVLHRLESEYSSGFMQPASLGRLICLHTVSEGSDETAHSRSLIKALAVRMMGI